MKKKDLPIVVIGAGPVGLAAAAHLNKRKLPFIILELGNRVANNVESWKHVSMFSPWKYNLDAAAVEILNRHGWTKPRLNKIPNGQELLEDYILPLSETDEIEPQIRLNSKVISISRRRINKMKNFGRDNAPFVIHIEKFGVEEIIYAKAIIDASGTWKRPNPIGADGLPAIGEVEHKKNIYYGIPDILGKDRDMYKEKNVAVIGGGHSAINSLLELADLKNEFPSTNLIWIMRKSKIEDAYGGLDADELPGRGLVGQRVKELVESGRIEVNTPFFVDKISSINDELVIEGKSTKGQKIIKCDKIIAATGLRPDLFMLNELRISIDNAVESPTNLAPLIDPNIHSCGSVEPHGEAELRHPEKDFYIVGMKSYGRAPTFLLATGYEQVRSVVAALDGDWEAAKEVHLSLPETGVCGVPAAVDPNNMEFEGYSESACCG